MGSGLVAGGLMVRGIKDRVGRFGLVQRGAAIAGCLLTFGAHAQSTPSAATAEPLLVERAAELGVDYVHQSGAIGRLLLPEIMGPGVALFDYDRDGDLDLYLAQSGELIANSRASELVPPEARTAAGRLYRNDLVTRQGRGVAGTLRFTDVTTASKLDARGYGQGVAVGDVNGDGWQDLYLTNVGANALWINRAGTFEQVESGAEDPRWSTSATFFDADGDGDLDLFVTNYAVWSVKKAVSCFATNSRRDYCGPQSYPPEVDGFFLNKGDGTFTATTDPAFAAAPGSGLGVVAFDANGDGRSDLFVANDGMANRLWLSDGSGWRDDGLLSGVAVNGTGSPEASMGVALGDVDSDGDLDVFLTHLDGETDTLLLNQDGGLFSDRTVAAGLGGSSMRRTSFGTTFVDLDADGALDLAIASGAVRLGAASGEAGSAGLGQPNQLLRNSGLGSNKTPSFRPWPASAAPGFNDRRVSRGLAQGDLDNDGDADLVLTNVDGPVQIFVNATEPKRWVGIELAGVGDHAAPLLGWRVVHGAQGRKTVAEVRTDGSYLSTSDPRIRLYGVAVGETIQILGRSKPSDQGARVSATIKVTEDMIGRYISWSPPENQ